MKYKTVIFESFLLFLVRKTLYFKRLKRKSQKISCLIFLPQKKRWRCVKFSNSALCNRNFLYLYFLFSFNFFTFIGFVYTPENTVRHLQTNGNNGQNICKSPYYYPLTFVSFFVLFLI